MREISQLRLCVIFYLGVTLSLTSFCFSQSLVIHQSHWTLQKGAHLYLMERWGKRSVVSHAFISWVPNATEWRSALKGNEDLLCSCNILQWPFPSLDVSFLRREVSWWCMFVSFTLTASADLSRTVCDPISQTTFIVYSLDRLFPTYQPKPL